MIRSRKLILEFEIEPEHLHTALKQAMIWGGASLAASSIGKNKKQLFASKKERSHLIKQGLIGAAAGFLGSMA